MISNQQYLHPRDEIMQTMSRFHKAIYEAPNQSTSEN